MRRAGAAVLIAALSIVPLACGGDDDGGTLTTATLATTTAPAVPTVDALGDLVNELGRRYSDGINGPDLQWVIDHTFKAETCGENAFGFSADKATIEFLPDSAVQVGDAPLRYEFSATMTEVEGQQRSREVTEQQAVFVDGEFLFVNDDCATE